MWIQSCCAQDTSWYTIQTDHTKELYAPTASVERITQADVLAHRLYAKFGYNFLPLISEYFGLTCSLDILFLRRDAPGQLIQSGGDIDNRIKVLLDGLRMPKSVEECKEVPKEGENPFFCLLEDDSLITKISITTDRLLSPMEKEEQKSDVHLLIHVVTKLIDVSSGGWPDLA
jgi:hypothetical protein